MPGHTSTWDINNMSETRTVSSVCRQRIEHLLTDPLVRLPHDLQAGFYAYQDLHYRRFLFLVNLLAQAAYLTYAMADLMLIPDVGMLSVIARSAFTAVVLPMALVCFRWSINIRMLDLLLPSSILVAAVIWFELLAKSTSPHVETFQYASIIFIVLANVGVQVRFLPSLVVSILISCVIEVGVHRLNQGHSEGALVFTLVYLPVFLFSIFISWSTTLDRRRTYLRSLMSQMLQDELHDANQKLKEQAHTDALTGLCNRRHFMTMAEREFTRAQRQHESLSLLFFDVDHFKQVNDTHGHDVGDKVLQAISTTALRQMREHDVLARFGGEEFVALLPHTDLDEALMVAERLRIALADCNVQVSETQTVRFTISVGVSTAANGASNLAALLKDADVALYQAKQNGRNQSCLSMFSSTVPTSQHESPI